MGRVGYLTCVTRADSPPDSTFTVGDVHFDRLEAVLQQADLVQFETRYFSGMLDAVAMLNDGGEAVALPLLVSRVRHTLRVRTCVAEVQMMSQAPRRLVVQPQTTVGLAACSPLSARCPTACRRQAPRTTSVTTTSRSSSCHTLRLDRCVSVRCRQCACVHACVLLVTVVGLLFVWRGGSWWANTASDCCGSWSTTAEACPTGRGTIRTTTRRCSLT